MEESVRFTKGIDRLKRKAEDCRGFSVMCEKQGDYLTAYMYAVKYYTYVDAIERLYSGVYGGKCPNDMSEYIEKNKDKAYGLMMVKFRIAGRNNKNE